MADNRSKHQKITNQRDRHHSKADSFADKAKDAKERARLAGVQMKSIETKKYRVQEQLNTKRSKLTQVVNRIQNLDTALNEKNAQLAARHTLQENLGLEADQVSLTVNQYKMDLKNNGQQLDQVKQHLETRKSELAVQKQKKDEAKKAVEQTRARIETLRSQIAVHSSAQVEAESSLTQLQSELTTAQSILTSLQGQLRQKTEEYRHLNQRHQQLMNQAQQLQKDKLEIRSIIEERKRHSKGNHNVRENQNQRSF